MSGAGSAQPGLSSRPPRNRGHADTPLSRGHGRAPGASAGPTSPGTPASSPRTFPRRPPPSPPEASARRTRGGGSWAPHAPLSSRPTSTPPRLAPGPARGAKALPPCPPAGGGPATGTGRGASRAAPRQKGAVGARTHRDTCCVSRRPAGAPAARGAWALRPPPPPRPAVPGGRSERPRRPSPPPAGSASRCPRRACDIRARSAAGGRPHPAPGPRPRRPDRPAAPGARGGLAEREDGPRVRGGARWGPPPGEGGRGGEVGPSSEMQPPRAPPSRGKGSVLAAASRPSRAERAWGGIVPRACTPAAGASGLAAGSDVHPKDSRGQG